MHTKKQLLSDITLIVLSAVVRAAGIHIFILPSNFAPGGVTGIATMLDYLFGISSGYMLLAMNIPLLLIALKYLSKGFAIKTLIAIVLSSVLLIILEKINFYQFHTEERLVTALAAGVLMGVGLTLMIRCGGSSGGSDIIGYMIQRKNEATNVAWYIFMIDATVIGISFFVYDFNIEPVVLSIVELFVASKVVETLTQGAKSAVKFEIITTCPDELTEELLSKVKCGVTKINAVGAFSNTEKTMLFCIVRKRDVTAFRTILKRFNNTTFSYISSASEVIGRGFSS